MKLFAVYLGGKAKNATTEVHDVVFVAATSVKKAFPRLRELWFGIKSSAHVDSWIDLSRVDGYDVELVPGRQIGEPKQRGPKLFLINVGFYQKRLFAEQHRYYFLVCRDESEAKARARKLYSTDAQLSHLDNVVDIDGLLEVSEVDGYRVRLKKGAGRPGVRGETALAGAELEINNVYWPLRARPR